MFTIRTEPAPAPVEHDRGRRGGAPFLHRHFELILTSIDLPGIEIAPQPLTFLWVAVRVGGLQPIDGCPVEAHGEVVTGNPVP